MTNQELVDNMVALGVLRPAMSIDALGLEDQGCPCFVVADDEPNPPPHHHVWKGLDGLADSNWGDEFMTGQITLVCSDCGKYRLFHFRVDSL